MKTKFAVCKEMVVLEERSHGEQRVETVSEQKTSDAAYMMSPC